MKIKPLLIAAALAAGLFWWKGGADLKLPDWLKPTPDVVVPAVPAPSAELQATVAPVKAAVAHGTPQDRAWLASLYRDFAAVLAADTKGDIASTAQVRTAYERSLTLMLNKQGFAGKFPALPTAVEAVMKTTLGETPKQLDASLRTKAVSMFEALSWACS